MSEIPVWIDTDCGVDDAIALFIALQLSAVKIVGVSNVCGNVEADKTFRNARNVLSFAGHQEIKVFPGAQKPLIRQLSTAKHVHGENGLGNIEIPESKATVETEYAWDALYRAAQRYRGELVVVPIGPLTNIAIALAKYPDLPQLLDRIVLMGGSVIGGNATPCAEFNIYADPQAAEAVFQASTKKFMFGLDVTMRASVSENMLRKIKQTESRVGQFAAASVAHCLKYLQDTPYQNKVYFHDVCPILYLQYPTLFKGVKAGVYVETKGALTTGKTCCDAFSDFKFDKRDTTVFLDVEQDRFRELIVQILTNYR